MGSNRATVHERRWQDLSCSRPAGGQARRDGDTVVGLVREDHGLVREDHGDAAHDCRVGQAAPGSTEWQTPVLIPQREVILSRGSVTAPAPIYLVTSYNFG